MSGALDDRVMSLLGGREAAAASELVIRDLGPGILRCVRSVVRERQTRALGAIRARLTVEEQSLLALRVDQGLSWGDVAAVLAAEGDPVNPDALAKRFQRLKDRIAEKAREDGLGG